MKATIYSTDGKASGSMDLDEAVFGVTPNDELIHRSVVSYLAAQRQGTASTKGRSQITGSTKKLYRQKGTGNARRGDIKAGILRGGGTMFGPKPRKYVLGLPKKMSMVARKSVLAYKAKDESILVIDSLKFESPSTKKLIELVNNMELNGKKVLLLTSDHNANVYLSSRTIDKVKVEEARNANTYDLINADVVVLEKEGLSKLTDILSRNVRGVKA